jgi:single-strand DNA-binding protein
MEAGMNGFNRVVLVGNLTRDPETKEMKSGTPVAGLGLAVNASYRNREGEVVDKTCFVDIDAWGRQAEACGQYLVKGARVLVEGRLEFHQWENGDGQRRSKLRVRADRILFLSRPNGQRDGEPEQAATGQEGQPQAAAAAAGDAVDF